MRHRSREVLFREAVLAALGVKSREQAEDEYCEVCRAAGRGTDCTKCDRKVEVIRGR